MYLYKVVTIGDITFYVNSDIEKLSTFTERAEKHFNTKLKSVEYLGMPSTINI